MRFFKAILVNIVSLFPFAFIESQDVHLLKMVNCINNYDFPCAFEELHLIKDWSEKEYLNDSKALDFWDYLDSSNVEDSLLDSVLIYLADDADIKFEIYFDQGNYQRAIDYEVFAANVYSDVLGTNNANYARSLNKLGVAYTEINNYIEAKNCYYKALDIRRSLYGMLHPDYIRTLVNLGGVYSSMGDVRNAELYYAMGLQKYNSLPDKNYPDFSSDYVTLLVNIGALYTDIGEYKKAEDYLKQAQQMYKTNRELVVDTLAYTGFLIKMSSLYLETGDYSHAINTLLEAKDIIEEYNETLNPIYGGVLNQLAVLYSYFGGFDKAETYLLQALHMYQNHPNIGGLGYLTLLHNLVTIYHGANNIKKAEEFAIKEYSECKVLISQSLNFMTEEQRSSYIKHIESTFDGIPCISYAGYRKKPTIACLTYDSELTRKGLLLQMSESIDHSILCSKNESLINEWERLKVLKALLHNLLENDPVGVQIHECVREVEAIENNIIRSSAAYRENIRQWNITWDSVRAALKPNQVAIEYMSAPLNEDSTMYCALLLRHDSKHPELIPLFNEKDVTSLLHTSTGDTTQINTTYMYGRNGKQLSTLIWGKILPLIKTGETLFCSPTGLLHQIAMENLPYNSTQTLGDVYNFVRLSSTRELVLNEPAIAHQTATLYGDIRYNASPAELAIQHEKYKKQEEEEDLSLAKVGRSTDRGFAKDLPGTKAEMEAILPILKSKHIHVQTFSSYEANEESFKALSGTHQNILHIGTHGFFWQDSTAQQEKFFTQRTLSVDKPSQTSSIDPLERCGLLFAGANTALSGHSDRLNNGVQDGILTAKEISLLDLRDADLVVLSACETGLGDISGEGVFGLQRAFKMAGAQTMLMALWKVDDDATRLLMTAFYRNMSLGMSKREAFRNAQQEVRATYKDPYFWAGFVMLD